MRAVTAFGRSPAAPAGRSAPESAGKRDASSDAAGDRALLHRLRGGDNEAYALVIGRHGARLLGTARRLLRDEDLAQEAVQEALVCAFRSISRFRADAHLATWLHRIVVNAALMKLRSTARRQEVSLDGLANAGGGVAASVLRAWPPPVDAQLVREETRTLVRQTIARLPAHARRIIELRDIQELSVADTARVLGITPNAVRIRVHRAHQALHALLAPALPLAA